MLNDMWMYEMYLFHHFIRLNYIGCYYTNQLVGFERMSCGINDGASLPKLHLNKIAMFVLFILVI